VLEDNGYEPEVWRGPSVEMVLRNCPFRGLSEADQALICAVNCELIAGVVTGLGADVLEARLIPRPDHCCVTVSARTRDEDDLPG
jgi:predicted ArsR family transcriptional regulator